MRKTTKSLLLASLLMLCAGILLTLGSFLFIKIADIDPYGVEQIPAHIEDKEVSLTEILSLSPNSNYVKKLSLSEFSKLDLLNFAGDLMICPTTEETHLSLKNTNTSNLSYEIIGDTLIVKEINPVGFFGLYVSGDGFTFKGLRQIFSSGIKANTGKSVTLYVNENTKLSQITVDSKIGDVLLDGIYTENATISCSNGNVTLQGLLCDTTKISVAGSLCDITANDCHFAILNCKTRLGSISAKIMDLPNQSLILDALCGKVNILTDAPTSNYKLTFTTMFGSITKNGETLGKELSLPTHTQSRISSTLIVGNVCINYSQGDESTYTPTVNEPETEETTTADPKQSVTEEAKTAEETVTA